MRSSSPSHFLAMFFLMYKLQQKLNLLINSFLGERQVFSCLRLCVMTSSSIFLLLILCNYHKHSVMYTIVQMRRLSSLLLNVSYSEFGLSSTSTLGSLRPLVPQLIN